MKKILLLLVVTSSYASLIGLPPTNSGSAARQVHPVQPAPPLYVAPPPPYNPEPLALRASMFETVAIQNQPPAIAHRYQPSQANQPQCSPCKFLAAACLTPAALLDTLLIPFIATANDLEYGEDLLSAWAGDTYSAPDYYLCFNQYSFTKALLNIACNCNYQTCIKCQNDENPSN